LYASTLQIAHPELGVRRDMATLRGHVESQRGLNAVSLSVMLPRSVRGLRVPLRACGLIPTIGLTDAIGDPRRAPLRGGLDGAGEPVLVLCNTGRCWTAVCRNAKRDDGLRFASRGQTGRIASVRGTDRHRE
jgi:hypothetical protein